MIEAAPRDVENVADSADAQTGLIFDRTDHLAPFFWALVPRITAAYFKMLFSSRSRDTSRLRTRNSSATASSPSARWPPLPSCEFLTHLRRRPSPIPSSLASSGIGLPALTRPTAWSLNSALKRLLVFVFIFLAYYLSKWSRNLAHLKASHAGCRVSGVGREIRGNTGPDRNRADLRVWGRSGLFDSSTLLRLAIKRFISKIMPSRASYSC